MVKNSNSQKQGKSCSETESTNLGTVDVIQQPGNETLKSAVFGRRPMAINRLDYFFIIILWYFNSLTLLCITNPSFS